MEIFPGNCGYTYISIYCQYNPFNNVNLKYLIVYKIVAYATMDSNLGYCGPEFNTTRSCPYQFKARRVKAGEFGLGLAIQSYKENQLLKRPHVLPLSNIMYKRQQQSLRSQGS